MRPGMNRDEARAVVDEIMPDVRAFVARQNGLKE
jgi:polyhydroxyalkanoate synthesis regulator phasin